MEQTTQTTLKERQPMKKKTLILTTAIVLVLIITAITLFLAFGKKPVNVKIVELPKEVGEFELGSRTAPEFVETAERMDELLARHYLTKEDEETRQEEALNDLKQQSKTFAKYNEAFFKDNMLFFTVAYSEYFGYISSVPNIEKQKSYIFKNEKLVIEVKIINEPTLDPKIIEIGPADADLIPDEHGFLIEIPRKQFEKYNMTYDDIEIVYLNSHDKRYNVQYGGDKFRLDPNYPQPIGFDYSKLKD